MTRVIPLFPLPLVLFPRALQALHIFEPRYRQMLVDCLASSKEFGLVYKPSGLPERDLPAGTVGCLARVESSQPLADGRSNIIVTGTERFAFLGFAEAGTQYHSATVEAVVDEPTAPGRLAPLAAQVHDVFRRAGVAARTMQDDPEPIPTLPDDPVELAFAVAQFVDLPLEDRQRLLASRSPEHRLRQLLETLAPVLGRMEEGAATHQHAKTNGHGPGHGPRKDLA